MDAVAGLLYLDHDRGEGWWRLNRFWWKKRIWKVSLFEN